MSTKVMSKGLENQLSLASTKQKKNLIIHKVNDYKGLKYFKYAQIFIMIKYTY